MGTDGLLMTCRRFVRLCDLEAVERLHMPEVDGTCSTYIYFDLIMMGTSNAGHERGPL
jgi:hypothetical protein